MAKLPPLHFLTCDADFVDYRPAVDASGELVAWVNIKDMLPA